MWLDRFSNHPSPSGTPPPQARSSYASASRRPYLAASPAPQRPGFSPRSSSLSFGSAASSTTSLPGTARLPNGSGLRRQVNPSPPEDAPDPLEVLEEIIGAPLKSKHRLRSNAGQENGMVEKPETVVEDIDFAGLSLKAFADAPTARRPSNVYTRSDQSVEEFDREKHKFEDLHKSISDADHVLDSVEEYLTHFQADLGAVSAEIETLQSRSIALSTKLENRKAIESLIGPTVDEISLPALVVKRISEGPIDHGFVQALTELEKRSKNIKTKFDEQSTIKALEDVKPLVEGLVNKAVERIRDYFVAQIKAIRSPSINAQIIQQDGFLKYKELFGFLGKQQPQLADEICQAYVNTMRWYYVSHFTKYQKALEKIKLHVIDKHDLLGQEETPKRSTLLGSTSRSPMVQHDAFSLGRRLDILKYPSHAAITAYLAEEEKSTHYIEVPFRAFNLALIDNASFEYTFLFNFFGSTRPGSSVTRTFNSIFEPTFTLGKSITKQLVDNTMDALGILLCVRLNQHFAFEGQRRKVPAVEGYINGTNMLLWPRFQQVIDQHCESIRRLTASLPNRANATSLLMSSPTTAATTAPYPTTQKFASFIFGILSLSSEAGDDEPVMNSLTRLRGDIEALLTKLSKSIGDQRKKERFLHNNYSLIGTILAEAEGRLADDMKAYFESLKSTHTVQG